MKFGATVTGVTMAAMLAGAAHAGETIIYPGPSAPQATDSSITLNFISPTALSADLSFTIDGYLTLDGQNFYEDDFSLDLNGSSIFVGTFNLGGGRDSGQQANVYSNPYGATYTNPTNNGTADSVTEEWRTSALQMFPRFRGTMS